jgi:hypothetical protein
VGKVFGFYKREEFLEKLCDYELLQREVELLFSK